MVRPSSRSTKQPSAMMTMLKLMSSMTSASTSSSSVEQQLSDGQDTSLPLPSYGDCCLLRRRIWFPKVSFNTLRYSRRGGLF